MGSQYCQPADLLMAINPIALQDVDTPTQTQGCIDASSRLDDAFRGRYQLPLLGWGPSVTRMASYIAVFYILSARGYNLSAGADPLIEKRYDEAIAWCEGVQRQSVHPDVTPTVLSVNSPTYQLPQVRTSPQRGWNQTRGGKPVI